LRNICYGGRSRASRPNARCRDLKAVGQLTSKGVSVEVVEGDALCRL
jgi:hypothetical protein